MKTNKNILVAILTAAAVVVAPSASAAIDVSGATSSITDGVTAVGVIGGAFIVISVLKKVWNKIGG